MVWDAGTPLVQPERPVHRHFGLLQIILLPRPQKALGRRLEPKTARLAVGNAQRLLHLPNAHASGKQLGRLLENRGLQVPGYLADAR